MGKQNEAISKIYWFDTVGFNPHKSLEKLFFINFRSLKLQLKWMRMTIQLEEDGLEWSLN